MLFSDDWSVNAALFERLMEIHSNPPILYYGFNFINYTAKALVIRLNYQVSYKKHGNLPMPC